MWCDKSTENIYIIMKWKEKDLWNVLNKTFKFSTFAPVIVVKVYI